MDVYLVESRSIGGLGGSPVFIDVRIAKTTRSPNYGWMAGAYDSSSSGRFKLLGLVHGHFGDDILSDATADDGKEKVHINMGFAMVVPAEKSLSRPITLSTFTPFRVFRDDLERFSPITHRRPSRQPDSPTRVPATSPHRMIVTSTSLFFI
jgi:hypothetical protein